MDGREIEAAGEDFQQLFAVVGDAAAGAAEGEAGADDDRETNFSGEFEAVFQIVDQRGFRDVEADLLHGVFEEEAVFGFLDGFDVGADQLDVVFVENAAVGKFDGEIERGLSADGGKNGEAGAGRHFALDANDLFEIFAGERLDVSAVGELGVGHDGGRVRVGEHHFKAFGLERLAGLGAGVVELGGLADDDGAGAEDEDFRDVSAFGHLYEIGGAVALSWKTQGPSASLGMTGLRRGSGFELLHHLHEIFEQVVRIVGAGAGLGVVLDAEERHVFVAQAFERVVV